MQGLEEELQKTHRFKNELEQIQLQLANVAKLQERYDVLKVEVEGLRSTSETVASLVDELKQLKASPNPAVSTPPALPSTPKPKSPRVPHPE